MNKKFGWGFLAFMLGLLAYAGLNAFLRDWPAERTDAVGNLVLGLVCSLLCVLCVLRIFKPRRIKFKDASNKKTHTAQKAFEREELHSVPSSGCDPLLREAANFITNGGTADVSTIQRKLKVSYSRASNILSQLEEIGIIEHPKGRKADAIPVPPIPATNRISIKPVPTSVPADYKRLSAKMSEWKKAYLLHDGSPTAERQKANLEIILRDPEYDLYQLSSHGSGCPFCAPREGRVYSRSGKSPDFPPLAMAFQKIDKDGPNVLWNTYLILHPDCRHFLTAWMPAGRSAEEINEIKRFSSSVTNPFSRDPRTPKQVEFFNRAIEGRRKWKESYNLFDECQSLGIENFPKTFQTFQKHQSENSPKYQDWMTQYEQKKGLARPKVEELITIHTEHIDPDEGIETPPWAELSYMDIKALKFWSRKSTDFQIPDYYADTAFGRNVGPARDRLLEGGYLQLGDIRKSIELKTVPDLKEVLAGKQLKTSGKKGELVQRLLDSIPPDELRDLFPVSPYEVTEKGWKAWSQYGLIFENQDYGLGFSYYRVLNAKKRNPQEEDAVILKKLLWEDIEDCYRTKNQTRYQELLPNGARFMEGHGEDLAALELTILSYFVWTMEAKGIPASAAAEQNRYLARNVEDYARRCSLTFEQLTEHFVETVRKNKPFGMSSEANINYALSMLKSGLSIK